MPYLDNERYVRHRERKRQGCYVLKKIILLICFCLLASVLYAQEDYASLAKQYNTALVVYDKGSESRIDENPATSGRRLSPCSTFKIYNTLIGLELGLIKGADVPWYKWDGVKRFLNGWNQDLTLREAFRVSAVPAYQELAREIGTERMREYIEKINYGTEDVSAGVDRFWLPSKEYTSIQISADEQVNLLNALLDGKLPFDHGDITVLKDIMLASETEKGRLYGKTGSGMGSDGKWNLGWYVGFLESNGNTYVFACNITGGESPSGLVARKIVEEYFRSEGLF